MLLACSFGFYGLVGEKSVNAKNLMNGQKLFSVSLKCPFCGRGQNGTCGISAFSLLQGLEEGRMLWPLGLSTFQCKVSCSSCFFCFIRAD